MMDVCLYNFMLPQFLEEYKNLKIDMPLENYLSLRKCEILANELRFPGYSINILKKAQGFARIFIGSLVVNVGLVIALTLKNKPSRSVVV